MVCYGVGIFGFAHIMLIIGGIPKLLQNGTAFAPFAIGVYALAFGGGE